MKILTVKDRELSDDEITTFQYRVDEFVNVWIKIFGEKGMTNYIHYLSAGHITSYLREYRNLSKYSNQGWEALNSSAKCYYFRATNKGGGGGTGVRIKTKLRAIALWLQRRILWSVFDCEFIFKLKQNELGLSPDDARSLVDSREEKDDETVQTCDTTTVADDGTVNEPSVNIELDGDRNWEEDEEDEDFNSIPVEINTTEQGNLVADM